MKILKCGTELVWEIPAAHPWPRSAEGYLSEVELECISLLNDHAKKRESGNKNIAAAVFRQTSVGVFRARCYTNLKKKMLGPQELWSYLIWKQIWWGLISEGLEALKISLISVQTVCSSSIKELIPSRSLKSSSHGTELFLRRKFFNYVNLYWLRGKESFPEDVA